LVELGSLELVSLEELESLELEEALAFKTFFRLVAEEPPELEPLELELLELEDAEVAAKHEYKIIKGLVLKLTFGI
jgi:hypothetical protein